MRSSKVKKLESLKHYKPFDYDLYINIPLDNYINNIRYLLDINDVEAASDKFLDFVYKNYKENIGYQEAAIKYELIN